jgi:hypothetical protein
MATPRFPSPNRYATNDEFFDAVYRYMTRITGAHLYAHYKTGEVIPTHDELVEWLDAQVSPKISNYRDDYQQESTGKYALWSGADYDRNVSNAAQFCLDTYDPEPIHARAVKGGRNSRRGPTLTLATFRAQDLSLKNVELARLLNVDAKTIKRKRDELADYDDVLHGDTK